MLFLFFSFRAACEYGDKVSNCDSQFCGRALDSGELYDVSCCGTCNHTVSTVTPVVTPPATTTMVTEVPPDIVICRFSNLFNLCVRACVRACARARARVCVCVCVCVCVLSLLFVVSVRPFISLSVSRSLFLFPSVPPLVLFLSGDVED